MKNQNLTVTPVGNVDIGSLTESQQKTFYITLLANVLKLYRQQKDGDGNGTQ